MKLSIKARKSAVEDLQESEVNITGSWRNENPRYIVAGSIATLPLAVIWEVENAASELSDLAKCISNQNTENTTCFLLLIVKCEETDKLKGFERNQSSLVWKIPF